MRSNKPDRFKHQWLLTLKLSLFHRWYTKSFGFGTPIKNWHIRRYNLLVSLGAVWIRWNQPAWDCFAKTREIGMVLPRIRRLAKTEYDGRDPRLFIYRHLTPMVRDDRVGR